TEGRGRVRDIVLKRTRRWQPTRRSAQIGGKQSKITPACDETKRTCQRRARIHVSLAEGTKLDAIKRAAVEKAIGRIVEAICPDTELRIIVKRSQRRLPTDARIGADGIKVPAAGNWVGSLRDRDALVVWCNRLVGPVEGKGKVGNDPAVCHRVIKNNRVAKIIRVAWCSSECDAP